MKLFNWKNSRAVNSKPDSNDISAELIFISYAREDRDFALRLYDSLKKLDRAAWLDINIPHTAEWKREIDEKINEATAIVFIISPYSTTRSSFCLTELKIATNCEKRIIPVLYKNVDYANVDSRLAKKQWINFTAEEDFDKSVVDLVTALNADLDYLKQHTYLGLEHTDWVRSGQDSNLLLKGKRLLEAEQWLQNVKKDFEPQPSQSHIEYINASRRYTKNRKKLSWVLAAAVLFSVIGVSVLAKNLFDNRKMSQANRLADKSLSFLDDDPEMSLSLAYKAVEIFPTEKAEQSLRQSLIKTPGKLVLKGHEKPLTDAAFSPDDRRIVTAGLDNTLRIWDSDTGKEIKNFQLPDSIQSLSFNPNDSNQILTVDNSGSAKLWSVENGNALDLQDSQCSDLFKAAFSSEGNFIVVADIDTVCLWKKDAAGYSRSHTLSSGEITTFKSFDISPKSNYIALVSHDSAFQINKLTDFSPVAKKSSSLVFLASVAFSRDENLLLVSGAGGTEIWDAKNWTRNDTIPHPTEFVSQRLFNLNSDRLLIPQDGGSALIYEKAENYRMPDDKKASKNWINIQYDDGLNKHEERIERALYGLNDDIVTVGNDLVVGVWKSPGGGRGAKPTKMLKLRGHTKKINGVSFNDSGSKIVSFSDDNTARVWDLADTDKAKTQTGVNRLLSGGFTSINFSPDGHYVVIGDVGGSATVWDLSSNESGGTPPFFFNVVQAPTYNAVMSPDNKWILVATGDGAAKIFEWKDEEKPAKTKYKPVKEFRVKEQYEALKNTSLEIPRGTSTVLDAKFSPNGEKIVTASTFATQLWDINSGKILFNLHSETGSTIVLFHPDGKRIISNSSSRDVIIISDAETGEDISELKAGTINTTQALTISPDGNFLASIDHDATVRVWNLNTYEIILTIKIFEGDGVTKFDGFETLKENISHSARKSTFSPDGKLLAIASEDGSAKIWVATTGELVRQFAGHTKAVTDINFSSDGKLIVTSSLDTTAKIWNAETGTLLFNLDDSKKKLYGAIFSPNDKYVITIGEENYIRMYKREVFAPLDELKKMAAERIMLDAQDSELTRNINE